MTTDASPLAADEAARWQALPWKLLPAVARPPLLNMALDEVLVERVGAATRPPTLRIWGWSAPCVVLGRFQSVRNEVDEEAAARHGIQIVRRISGGGAMFSNGGRATASSSFHGSARQRAASSAASDDGSVAIVSFGGSASSQGADDGHRQ